MNQHAASYKVIAAKSSADDTKLWLPLYIHLCDTAGVMRFLIERWMPFDAKDIGLDKEELIKAAVFAAAAHDIGKATPLFQYKISRSIPFLNRILSDSGLLMPSRKPTIEEMIKYGSHSIMGAIILNELGCPEEISVIIGSHHGSTPGEGYSEESSQYSIVQHESFFRNKAGDAWETAQGALIGEALKIAGYRSIDDLPAIPKFAQVIMTGMLIMADWIASNTDYFPLCAEGGENDICCETRIEQGLKKLSLPLRWEPVPTSESNGIFINRFGFSANKVQESVLSVNDEYSPEFVILEAPMGCGKTEAALVLAEKMAEQTGKNGIAFFLPSQATSNSIFERLMSWAETLEHSEPLSVALAHGMASFNEQFANVPVQTKDLDYQPDIVAHQFFRGGKSRLLANFVVGTIDQLLMAALKQKHMMLRHLGLAGKVVIIDECHAYDAYMNVFLDRILEYLHSYNVPVILLSATLPAESRIRLVKSYMGKRELNSQEENSLRALNYPMLTFASHDKIGVETIEIDNRQTKITIEKIKFEEIGKYVSKAISDKACVGVIVNTVKRAQEIADTVRNYQSAKVILCHAQFAMPDRKIQEESVMSAVGKKSDREARAGAVIIGTQVLEQSLDIDFDLLITDLCPMDLLLQRIGRLHRHKTRIRPKGYENAKCLIIGADCDELEPATKAIYGEYLLLRTRALLPDRITLPNDIATLVQKVYDETDTKNGTEPAITEAYFTYKDKEEKQQRKAESYLLPLPSKSKRIRTIESMAEQNSNAAVTEDGARAAVRDGEPSVEVLLIKETENGYATLDGKIVFEAESVPDNDTAKEIAKWKLRLPKKITYCKNEKDVMKYLSEENRSCLSNLTSSPWLHDELFLVLDKELSAKISDKYLLTYNNMEGLRIVEKDS